jgi:integrase
VTQAREPRFYQDLGVPDTVNGRFDLLVLHLWMVLRRMKLDATPHGFRSTFRTWAAERTQFQHEVCEAC